MLTVAYTFKTDLPLILGDIVFYKDRELQRRPASWFQDPKAIPGVVTEIISENTVRIAFSRPIDDDEDMTY